MKINQKLLGELEKINNETILNAFNESENVTECYRKLFGIENKKDLPSITIHTLRFFLKKRGLRFKTLEEKYSENPWFCKQCGKLLTYEDFLNKKTFCSQSCAAVYNNALRELPSEETKEKIKQTLRKKFGFIDCYCKKCGELIGSFSPRKPRVYCDKCNEEIQNGPTRLFELWKTGENSPEFSMGSESIMLGELKHSLKDRIKPYLLEEQENKCAICGCPSVWNGQPLTFVLDHKDGNWENQQKDNLRMICPNCNSQLETTKHKEKGTGRYSKRLEYVNFRDKFLEAKQ